MKKYYASFSVRGVGLFHITKYGETTSLCGRLKCGDNEFTIYDEKGLPNRNKCEKCIKIYHSQTQMQRNIDTIKQLN